MDHQFNLNNQLEYSFGMEFKKMWDQYRETQKKILDGELPVNYGEKERNINTFNVMPEYNDADNKENDNEVEYFNSLNNNINDDDKEEETKELYSQLDNSYHTHYLLEDEDYHEFDELNTINDDEENKYNNKHIINHLQQLPIQEEEKISKNEQYLNENKDDIINNQEKQNLYNLQQVNIPVNNIKKMKNAAKALKDKYLRK